MTKISLEAKLKWTLCSVSHLCTWWDNIEEIFEIVHPDFSQTPVVFVDDLACSSREAVRGGLAENMSHVGTCHNLQRAPALPDLWTHAVTEANQQRVDDTCWLVHPDTGHKHHSARLFLHVLVCFFLRLTLFFILSAWRFFSGSVCSVHPMRFLIPGVFSAELGFKNLRFHFTKHAFFLFFSPLFNLNLN